jgi:uncharacterized protein YndB with AHSA1/START domain
MAKENNVIEDERIPAMMLDRLLNAPRAVVWEAWTNEIHVAKWWGSDGFTNELCIWNVEKDNDFLIRMQSPHGNVFSMVGHFKEIVFNEKLLFTSSALDETGNVLLEILISVEFSEKDEDKTAVKMSFTVISVAPQARAYIGGISEGWSQSLNRLNGILPSVHLPKTNDLRFRQLLMNRMFDAPRSLVFEVFTKPDHIKNWWGPDGFQNTISKMDVQPGGKWELIMRGPNGTDFKNAYTYQQVIYNEQLVMEHHSTPHFISTIRFTSVGKKTLLSMHMLFDSTESVEMVKKVFKADEGLKQNLSKLGTYLERNDLPVIIEKVYAAPISQVWKALTDKDEMKKWYFDVPAFKPEPGCEFEFTAGETPEKQFRHLCRVTEVIPERKIAYTWRYDGVDGESLVSFALEPLKEGTRLTLIHEGLHTFPQSADFKKENFIKGWTYFTEEALAGFLAGESARQ